MTELSYSTTLSQTSTVLVERGAASRLGKLVAEQLPAPRQVALITDRNVAPFCQEPVEAALQAAGFETKAFLVPAGEESKSFSMLGNLWDRLVSFGMTRDSAVVALGGGVVGDLAGMGASTLLRGVPVIQVPTSLLAQVDASIGGKTAVNTSAGKNLVGTFWHPTLVVIDPDLLDTLPDDEFRSGLGEVVKYGMIRDASILDRLARFDNLAALREDAETLESLIRDSASIKVGVVAADARESGERAHLNFGHTVGHAIETAESYQGLSHGEAVSVGMVAASFLAVDLGVAPAELPGALTEVLLRFELPVDTPHAPEDLLPHMAHDKKRIGTRSRWVLVPKPGEAILFEDPAEASVIRALQAVYRPTPPVEDSSTES